MKKLSLKSKILLGAFLFAGVGAGAQEVAFQIVNANQQVYDWEGDGPENSGSYRGTEDGAKLHYGCPSGTIVCAEGTAPGQTVQIFKSSK